MRKIPSVFKRNYETDRLVRDEIVEGCEWVLNGEGTPTVKWDGTACLVQGKQLFKRYDRRPSKKRRRKGPPYNTDDFNLPPEGWSPCEDKPNEHTGHWPGWLIIGDGPEDQWHREAWETAKEKVNNGTYELIGPKIQGNPYNKSRHLLIEHGIVVIDDNPRSFDSIKKLLTEHEIEGIVWHHPDGRMAKIKRRDFGLPWPPSSKGDEHGMAQN